MKIQKLVEGFMKCLSEMFNINVPLNPKLCVLGIY